ncbi:MAG: MBL fold metallo-hydrolase RNA specificity domain-containing protein, partial [Planctomycetota bacterium]
APTAEPPQADVLVMESTYGKPLFRFPPAAEVRERLVDAVTDALAEGRQPIVYGYALGKAQEIVRVLTDAGFPVTEHGAVRRLSDLYESFGVPLGHRRTYDRWDFHGKRQLPLEERGVLVAPPNAARGSFTAQFDNPFRVVLTGWSLFPNAIYRYGVDLALPLSDHADYDELLTTIDIVQPKKVYTHHGFKEFADDLRARGIDAKLAKPPAQMELFA